MIFKSEAGFRQIMKFNRLNISIIYNSPQILMYYS